MTYIFYSGILDKLADKYGFVKGASYHNVSMGQGQVSVRSIIRGMALCLAMCVFCVMVESMDACIRCCARLSNVSLPSITDRTRTQMHPPPKPGRRGDGLPGERAPERALGAYAR